MRTQFALICCGGNAYSFAFSSTCSAVDLKIGFCLFRLPNTLDSWVLDYYTLFGLMSQLVYCSHPNDILSPFQIGHINFFCMQCTFGPSELCCIWINQIYFLAISSSLSISNCQSFKCHWTQRNILPVGFGCILTNRQQLECSNLADNFIFAKSDARILTIIWKAIEFPYSNHRYRTTSGSIRWYKIYFKYM